MLQQQRNRDRDKRAREKMGEGVFLNREPLKALNESDQKSM